MPARRQGLRRGRERSEEPRGGDPTGDAPDRRHRSRPRWPDRQPDPRKRRRFAARQERRRKRRPIQGVIVRVHDGFASVGREIDGVAKAATDNLAHCDMVIDELGDLAGGVNLLDRPDARRRSRRQAARRFRRPDRADRRKRRRNRRHAADPHRRSTPRADIGRLRDCDRARRDQAWSMFNETYREIPAPIPNSFSPITSRSPTGSCRRSRYQIRKIDPRIVFWVAWSRGGYLRPTIRNLACRKAAIRSGTLPIAETGGYSTTARCRRSPPAPSRFAADLPAGHGRWGFRADEGPVVADPDCGRQWGAFRMGFRQS